MNLIGTPEALIHLVSLDYAELRVCELPSMLLLL